MTRADLNDQGKMKKAGPLKTRPSKTLAFGSTLLMLSCAVGPLSTSQASDVHHSLSPSRLTQSTNLSVVCPGPDDPQNKLSFSINPLTMPIPGYQNEEKEGIELTKIDLHHGPTSSFVPSIADVELPHSKAKSIPPTPAVTAFLNTMGWSLQDLQNHHISLETLERILAVETSRVWNSVRWAAMDRWLARVFHLPLLDFGGLGHTASGLKEHNKYSWSRFWMHGRSLPLQSEWTFLKAVTTDAFREGLEAGVEKGLSLTFAIILMYQLAQPSDNILSVYRSSNTNSVLAIANSFRNNPSLFAFFVVPPTVGLVRGLIAALTSKHTVTPNHIKDKERRIKEMKPGLKSDYLRWMLPLHPVARSLRSLEQKMAWEGQKGKLGAAEREAAYELIKQIADQENRGLTQTEGFYNLYRLAYATHLQDLPLLIGAQDKETLLQMVAIKIRALQDLQNAPASSKLTEAYRNYYLWSLGQSPSFGKVSVPMATMKEARLTTQILSAWAIIKTIMAYLDCPDRPGLTFSGYQKWSSDFTQDCFDELVNLFNTIPGQPAHTLTDGIPQYHFPDGTYNLDLSNKNLEDSVILDILQGFLNQTQGGQGPTLTGINLSGNQIGYQNDQNTVALAQLLAKFPSLQTLLLSNNQIGLHGIQGVQQLVQTLQGLKALKTFSILPSRTLSARMVDMLKLTGNPGLLPPPARLASADDVRVFFQTANLSTTAFDFAGMITDDAAGIVLTTLMNALRDYNLASLDISGNFIGINGGAGTQALQGLSGFSSLTSVNMANNALGYSGEAAAASLIQALSALPGLTALYLHNNWLGSTGNNTIQALNQLLQTKSGLKTFTLLPSVYPLSSQQLGLINLGLTNNPALPLLPFPLTDPATVDLYFQAVRPGTTSFNFSGVIYDDAAGATMRRLMQRLLPYNASMTSLDVSGNGIGQSSDLGTQVFGQYLRNLTGLVYLSVNDNDIGNWKDTGTQFIGQSLAYLKSLQYLNMGKNQIGSGGDGGPQAIGQSLRNLTNLLYLYLGGNGIGVYGDTGTQVIGQGVLNLRALISLDLSNNWIGWANGPGPQIIAQNLGNHTALRSISLHNNYIGKYGNQSLLALAQTIQTLPALESFSILSTIYPVPQTTISLLNAALTSHQNVPLLPVFLSTPQDVAAYFQTVPPLTSSFNFSGMIFDDAAGETMTALMQQLSLYSKTLTSLDVSNNNIGSNSDMGTQIFGQYLRNLTALAYLNLWGNQIGNRGNGGIQFMARSLSYLSSLSYLNLGRNRIGISSDAGPQAIGQSLPNLKALRYLNLGNNQIGAISDMGMQAISQSVGTLTNLISLDLSKILMGETEIPNIDNLVQSLRQLAAIQDFRISSPYLSASDIARLNLAATYHPVVPASSVLLKDLAAVQAYFATIPLGTTKFNFPGNLTDDASGATLTTFMQYLKNYSTSVTYLDLSNNGIGLDSDLGTQALAQVLPEFKALQYLNLSNNQIGFQGGNGTITLGQSLSQVPSLLSLNLGYNQIGSTGPTGSSAIVSAIPSLVNLQDLNLLGLTNIQWNENLVNINAFTSRKLQAACQSQLCHGTSITSSQRASTVPPVTSSASRLQAPLPFRLMNNAIKGVGNFLFNAWNSLMDKMTDGIKDVTTNSPTYFPNINNRMSDWQPNPFQPIANQQTNYSALLYTPTPLVSSGSFMQMLR